MTRTKIDFEKDHADIRDPSAHQKFVTCEESLSDVLIHNAVDWWLHLRFSIPKLVIASFIDSLRNVCNSNDFVYGTLVSYPNDNEFRASSIDPMSFITSSRSISGTLCSVAH